MQVFIYDFTCGVCPWTHWKGGREEGQRQSMTDGRVSLSASLDNARRRRQEGGGGCRPASMHVCILFYLSIYLFNSTERAISPQWVCGGTTTTPQERIRPWSKQADFERTNQKYLNSNQRIALSPFARFVACLLAFLGSGSKTTTNLFLLAVWLTMYVHYTPSLPHDPPCNKPNHESVLVVKASRASSTFLPPPPPPPPTPPLL